MNTSSIHIPGFTIAYKTWGESHLPPLLALHGWLDNANSFDLLAPYLHKQFYLIAIDLPGHGHSSHLHAGSHYHLIDAIFIILDIIEALGFKQVHLLGHSMGACLGSLVAGVAPEQILSMALIEGLGPFSNPEDSCRKQLANYWQQIHTISNKEAKPYSSMTLAAQARANNGYLALEHAEILCQRGVQERQGQFYWAHDRRLSILTPLQMTEGQIISCLNGVMAQSCLILADKGFAFDEKIIEQRIRAVKNLQVHQLQGGHHIHMEKPDTVAQCLVKFYSNLFLAEQNE